MNTNKQAAFAVVGAMQSVAGPVVDACVLLNAKGLQESVNTIRASVSLAASYAGTPGKRSKDVVIRHAELVLEVVDGLPEYLNESVSRQLDFAREEAKNLRAMLDLYQA